MSTTTIRRPKLTVPPIRALLASAAVLLMPAAAARAAETTVPPDPDARTIIHTDGEGRRTMLLDPRSFPLYAHLGMSPAVKPTITIEHAGALGYDIVYDFDNTTNETAKLGRLGVGIITLGPELTWYDHNRDSEFRTVRREDYRTTALVYPERIYSPLAVLMNDRYAVGVSLLYDLMGDRHDVRVGVLRPDGGNATGPGGAGYAVTFELADAAERSANAVQYPATLEPGESRRYIVAVRAVELTTPRTVTGPQQWLETIKPYRDHFHNLYGGVTYERDPRPIRKRAVSNIGARTTENPDAFMGHDSTRPDLVGFAPLANEILHESQGFDTTMLWAPSGLQKDVRLNFPNRMTSRWLTSEKLSTAFEPARGLASVPRRGGSFGLWWGRAAQYNPAWNTLPLLSLDYTNPTHLAFAENELNLAIQAGATTIGLDAYIHSYTPVWQQYEWITKVRREHPDLRIVIEPVASDVMHTVAGTFFRGWQIVEGRGYDRFYKVKRPFYLADYILPGHETWAYFRYGDIRNLPDGSHDAVRIQRDAEFFGNLGYTPILNTTMPLTAPARGMAKPTWLTTVPESLKTAAHRIGNPPVAPVADPGNDGDAGGGDDNANRKKPGDGRPERRPMRLPNGRIIWFDPKSD